jgi:hypothetical protein
MVVNFGFSAFLKILSMSDRRQRTELRRRLGPSTGSGYDFHRRFRQLAGKYLESRASLADVLTSAGTIIQAPERTSALAALERLALWRAAIAGEIVSVSPAVYESPRRLFRVRFEPDVGLRLHGQTVALHIWNTKSVTLSPGATYAALCLIDQAYENQGSGPDSVGVLSMREPVTLYKLSDISDRSAIATSVVERLEELIEGPIAPPSSPEDRPVP